MHPRIHAQNQPDAISLIMAGSGETITYAQLEARANRTAHALRALGIGIGDTIAVVCDNRPEFFDLFWGTQRSGITMVPVSTRLKFDEIVYIVEDSGSKLLLISEYLTDTAQELAKARASMPGLEHILAIGAIGGLPSWGELCVTQPATPVADEANGARMSYSSGTTGRPKGIKNAVPFAGSDPIQPQGAVRLFGNLYPFDENTVYLPPPRSITLHRWASARRRRRWAEPWW
jgi:long-chain acyl-CoA synthetase